MGRHPIWGESKRTSWGDGDIKQTAMGVPWEESPYYWWWYALRLNEKYKRVCDKGGKTSNQKLARVYRDFGDVHGNNSFKVWWRENNRGAELFAEPPAPLRVHTLKQGDLEDYETVISNEQAMVIAVPLWLSKREIYASIKKEVDKVHPAKRGKPALKNRQDNSQARYKLSHFRDIRSLTEAIRAAELRNNGLKLREIREARHLSLNEEYEKAGRDIPWMESSNIHRLVVQGRSIIEHTAKGLFPIRELPKLRKPKK